MLGLSCAFKSLISFAENTKQQTCGVWMLLRKEGKKKEPRSDAQAEEQAEEGAAAGVAARLVGNQREPGAPDTLCE